MRDTAQRNNRPVGNEYIALGSFHFANRTYGSLQQPGKKGGITEGKRVVIKNESYRSGANGVRADRSRDEEQKPDKAKTCGPTPALRQSIRERVKTQNIRRTASQRDVNNAQFRPQITQPRNSAGKEVAAEMSAQK